MAEPVTISIRFWNELQDHLDAQRVLYRRTLLSRLDKVVAALLFGFGVYLIVSVGVQWWTLIWFPLSVAEWFDLLSPSRWRTRIEFGRNPKFREEYHLTFSPQNIYFKTFSLESTLQWTHYERVIESPTLFLLMYGKGLYTLVPKRCFGSPENMDNFRVLLRERIPEYITT